MKVGDLVVGKAKGRKDIAENGVMGVILKTYVGWYGDTPCVRVYFPELSQTKDTPEHWLEVVCAGR